jgi:FlaA1/EpsC-like NDP-sugar epimerase
MMNKLEISNLLKDKTVLVTGGTGSIGSEIVRQALKFHPKAVRVFSRDEAKQFELQYELRGHDNMRYLVGDIRDKERLYWAAEGVDIIFHAAALKQVPSCEYNPFEAVKTNVVGTQNLIEVALDEKVQKVIAISTDKAALPTNTMGASKLLAERLITAANFYKGLPNTRLSCVRFGNVLGSRCSIVPLICKQVKDGGPVTVTEDQATRFIMSIQEAVNLVLKAALLTEGGEIFVLKMPTVKISDLIEVLVEESCQIYGRSYKDIEIKKMDKRRGEKVHEDLLTEEESQYTLERDDMYVVNYFNGQHKSAFRYTSLDQKPLSKKEIKSILYKENLLWPKAESLSS